MTALTVTRVPLSHPDKPLFISHINEDHLDELAMFADAFTALPINESTPVKLQEIYANGIDITIEQPDVAEPSHHFVPFAAEISAPEELNHQYVLLLQKAAKKLGKKTIKLQEQTFTLQQSYLVTPNMLRLVVSAPADSPLTHPGYAYLFDLSDVSAPADSEQTADSATRQHCYYTLRRAWQEAGQTDVTGWIDVYIHGDTPGGNWASSLQPGATLKSLREFPEKIDHLGSGQCLLIADETSLPTIARLLETWQNPVAPIILAITNDPKDADYLRNLEWHPTLCNPNVSDRALIIPITNSPTLDLPAHISDLLNSHEQLADMRIDKVWGALEANDAKALRKLLKDQLALSRQELAVKVYWRLQ